MPLSLLVFFLEHQKPVASLRFGVSLSFVRSLKIIASLRPRQPSGWIA
jgi:hypothetical protein